jgi:Arc-like DNA binding domain
MTKRPRAATVDIGLRVKEPVRARIERAAKDNGVSMNTEINGRLDSSFTKEDIIDRMFGGPEMRRMAMLWAAVFSHGARLGAYMEHGGKVDREVDPKEFTNPTTTSYQRGADAVVDTLMKGMPSETKKLFIQSLIGRAVTDEINERRRAKGES